MPGWWGGSTCDVKCAAFVSTAGDPRAALAVEPDHRPLDAGLQLAALAVVQEEGVQLGQQRHRQEPSAARRRPRGVRAWTRLLCCLPRPQVEAPAIQEEDHAGRGCDLELDYPHLDARAADDAVVPDPTSAGPDWTRARLGKRTSVQ
jgi:hypothetical protein